MNAQVKQFRPCARHHAVVVRLKGGDPTVFARLDEEIDALDAAGIDWEIVPGITAASSAAAAAGHSLTRRGVSRSVAFVTPRVGAGEDRSNWLRAALAADTAVIYMASHEAGAIAAALVAGGLPPGTPAVIVEAASLPGRQVVPSTLAVLGEAAGRLRGGPALIVIGENFRGVAACTAVAGADLASTARVPADRSPAAPSPAVRPRNAAPAAAQVPARPRVQRRG
jgi:uroporphyrin-III C-methyltransferase